MDALNPLYDRIELTYVVCEVDAAKEEVDSLMMSKEMIDSVFATPYLGGPLKVGVDHIPSTGSYPASILSPPGDLGEDCTLPITRIEVTPSPSSCSSLLLHRRSILIFTLVAILVNIFYLITYT
jgi:hypothetical protein